MAYHETLSIIHIHFIFFSLLWYVHGTAKRTIRKANAIRGPVLVCYVEQRPQLGAGFSK